MHLSVRVQRERERERERERNREARRELTTKTNTKHNNKYLTRGIPISNLHSIFHFCYPLISSETVASVQTNRSS